MNKVKLSPKDRPKSPTNRRSILNMGSMDSITEDQTLSPDDPSTDMEFGMGEKQLPMFKTISSASSLSMAKALPTPNELMGPRSSRLAPRSSSMGNKVGDVPEIDRTNSNPNNRISSTFGSSMRLSLIHI